MEIENKEDGRQWRLLHPCTTNGTLWQTLGRYEVCLARPELTNAFYTCRVELLI